MNQLRPIVSFRLMALWLSLALAGCAAIVGPREVVLPVEKLQQTLAGKLPANTRYLELIDVGVTNPRLQLNAQSNRVAVTVDAAVTPVFGRRVLRGSFRMSGVLAIDAARQAVVLKDPRMEELTIDGMDATVTEQLAKIGGLLALRLLKDAPLHTFTAEQFRYGGAQYFPTRISTTPQALVVTFEPAK
ncbi:MAG: DUF1439 domain-containing protein [Herminiimonas sp.]|nr:DUF1439 domain-containing protein [Herminiimonas sp.]